jgi:hypothetical protein
VLIDQRARDKGTAERYRPRRSTEPFATPCLRRLPRRKPEVEEFRQPTLRFFFCHAQANGVFITHLRFVDLIPIDMARPQEYQQVCARLY